jgi:hypothetical protein
MNAPPQAIAPNLHTNFLNAYIQIVNKMEFQQKKSDTQKDTTIMKAQI